MQTNKRIKKKTKEKIERVFSFEIQPPQLDRGCGLDSKRSILLQII